MATGVLEITPLGDTFGARVSCVRLSAMDAEDFRQIRAAWIDYGLLIFPGQFLSRDEQVSAAQWFGPLEFTIIPISNVRDDGRLRDPDDAWVRVLKGNHGWHIDSSFAPIQSKGALLTAHVVTPSGGETEWADTAAAYDALPETMKGRIAGLAAFHSIRHSQALVGDEYRAGPEHGGYAAETPPPLRPLVKTHPETGRKSLMVGRHAFGVPGLSASESQALLQELLDFASAPQWTWRHAWKAGDAALWDNRRTMHRGLPWDLSRPRVLLHTRIAGDPVTEFAPAS